MGKDRIYVNEDGKYQCKECLEMVDVMDKVNHDDFHFAMNYHKELNWTTTTSTSTTISSTSSTTSTTTTNITNTTSNKKRKLSRKEKDKPKNTPSITNFFRK